MALIYQPSKRIFCGWFEPLKSTTYSEYPNRVPYFNNNRNDYLNGVFAYGLTRKAPPMELYFAVVAVSNENFHVTGTVHFNDGSTCKFEKSVINGIEVYEQFKRNNGTRAKIVFDQTPSGYL